jgi:hypothetical protein
MIRLPSLTNLLSRWTVKEFTKWCHDAARAHGYEVAISGVGEGGDDAVDIDESRYASHTAIFTRLNGKKANGDDDNFQIISANHFFDEESEPISPASEQFEAFEIIEYKEADSNREGVSSPPNIIAALDVNYLFPASYQITQEEGEGEKLSIVDLTHDVILYIGKEVEEESIELQKVYEAEIWSVWMCEDVRWACQGRLDFWLESIGIIFHDDYFACHGEIQMTVKQPDLFLSIVVPEGSLQEQTIASSD